MTEQETENQTVEHASDSKPEYDPNNVEPDFVVDETPSDESANREIETVPSNNANDSPQPLPNSRQPTRDASSNNRTTRDIDRDGNGGHRVASPSQVLFLPNMSPHANERDLADLSKRCPGKVRKTFMYMSSSAHHGFVECESIDDASRILDWINNSYIEVRGKRVFAEFSRRKNVEDRSTYEHRQSIRKESSGVASRGPSERGSYRKDDYVDDRGPHRRDRGSSFRSGQPSDSGAYRAIDRPPHRRDEEPHSYRQYREEGSHRRRSRSPPSRSGPPRSPPRGAYPSRGDHREDNYYRRERDQYQGYPPYEYERRPHDDYHAPPPSRSYQPAYESSQYRQAPPQYDEYRPRDYPSYPPSGPGYSGQPAPYYQEPHPQYPPKQAPVPVAHPLLSLQPSAVSGGHPPVRSTPIGTRPNSYAPAYPPSYPFK